MEKYEYRRKIVIEFRTLNAISNFIGRIFFHRIVFYVLHWNFFKSTVLLKCAAFLDT